MCYQPNEYYFVRKFYLFSHLRNIIVPENLWTRTRHVLTSFKEFPSKNGRAFLDNQGYPYI